MQFDDDWSIAGEMPIEGIDIGEAPIPYPVRHESPRQLLLFKRLLMHAHDANFLIVRAIEYADVATGRQVPGGPS
jgi:hypothetical protein